MFTSNSLWMKTSFDQLPMIQPLTDSGDWQPFDQRIPNTGSNEFNVNYLTKSSSPRTVSHANKIIVSVLDKTPSDVFSDSSGEMNVQITTATALNNNNNNNNNNLGVKREFPGTRSSGQNNNININRNNNNHNNHNHENGGHSGYVTFSLLFSTLLVTFFLVLYISCLLFPFFVFIEFPLLCLLYFPLSIISCLLFPFFVFIEFS
jgi:hypothetical protein